MRRFIEWTFVPAALVAVVALTACGKHGGQSQTAMNPDLQRDLKLASATQTLQIDPDEIAPESHQAAAVRPKAAPTGPKVIRSQHPTVKASAKPAEVAEVETQVPQIEVMESAPSASPAPETQTSDAPPLARPSSGPAQTYPVSNRAPDGDAGSSGGTVGSIIGAVIRGGMIGDDDHCDPHGRRGGGRPIGGDIYGTGGSIIGGIIGGMAGGRMPRGRP